MSKADRFSRVLRGDNQFGEANLQQLQGVGKCSMGPFGRELLHFFG